MVPRPVPALALLAPSFALAAPAGETLSFGNVLQVLVGLAVVLGAFALTAAFLRRATRAASGRAGALRVVDAVAVGTRERVLLVEVEGERVLVGIAPGHIAALANLGPRPAATPVPAYAALQAEAAAAVAGRAG